MLKKDFSEVFSGANPLGKNKLNTNLNYIV